MGRPVRQGEVYWVVFEPPDKRRPVVILTRSEIIPRLNRVTVAPITTAIRNIATEVRVGPGDGLPLESAVNLDNVSTVPKAQIGQFITRLDGAKLREIRAAIEFAFGLDRMG